MGTMPHTGSDPLARIGHHVRSLSVPTVAVAALAICVFANGVGLSPAFNRFLAMSQHPASDPGIVGTGSFVLSSPSASWLAAAVGAMSQVTFAAAHMAMVVGAFTGSVWAVSRGWGSDAAKVTALLWAALPLSAVLVRWIGQPDPLMMASGTGLALSRHRGAVAGWGLLAGLTSGLQGLLIVAALTISDERPSSWWAFAGAGVAAGVATVLGWHQWAGIIQNTNRVAYLADVGPVRMVRTALSAWQPLLWSLFAGAWPLVLLRGDRRLWGTLAGLATVVLLTYDSTRVFGLLSWPLVLLLACREDVSPRMVGWPTVAAAAVPPAVVWAGKVTGPVWG